MSAANSIELARQPLSAVTGPGTAQVSIATSGKSKGSTSQKKVF